jgi:hypothetical protein
VIRLLLAQEHPGVLLLQGQKVDAASLDPFARGLDAAAIRCKPTRGFMSLRSAMIRYPGEKPWGRVLEALLTKRIAFYIDGPQPANALNMMVRPSSLPPHPLRANEQGDDILDLTHVSMRDAGEILGAGFDETAAVIASTRIEIIRYGKGKGVSREAVQRLAGAVAFTGEAAVFSSRTAVGLYNQLKRDGVSRRHGGWSRPALVKLGLASDLSCIATEEPTMIEFQAQSGHVRAA